MTSNNPKIGSIAWTDLTIPDAERLREFYSQVVGWKSSPVSMGDYSDFSMLAPDGDQPVAGVCHARGGNADQPAQWMIYILVANLDVSIESCRELGGKVVVGPKTMGADRYCVIQDPAGAVCALYQKGAS